MQVQQQLQQKLKLHQREELRPRLRADREDVPEPSVGHERRARTSPLEERVRGDGRSESHVARRRWTVGRGLTGIREHRSDRLERRSVRGQQLHLALTTIGGARDAVRERAAWAYFAG